MSRVSPTIASQLRRRRGNLIRNTRASAAPPVVDQNILFISFPAVVGAVVKTVSVDVCAEPPLSVTEAGLKLHVAGSLAATGLTVQLRFTVPENPFIPATLIVEVFPVCAPGETVIGAPLPLAPLGPNVGSAVTVRETVVIALIAPEVPVTVTVTGPPTLAVLAAVSVNTSVPASVPAAKFAETPLGNPDAANAIVPVKPPMSVTETVVVPLPFSVSETLAGEAVNVKPGATFTVTETVLATVL
jgi:hypothetical protein